MLRKIFIGLGAVIVLLLAAAIIVPMLIPLDTYKQQLARQVEAATGREFAIAGDVSLSLLPRLALEANQVRLSNPPGATNANMLELETLEMRLALLPLLSGEVVLDSFALIEPVINLEIDAQGRPNWQFHEAATAPEPEPQEQDGTGPTLRELSLGDVRLVDGRVTYFDARTGAAQTAENIDMTIALPSLDQSLEAEGGLTWNGEDVTLQATVAAPRALIDGQASAVEAAIGSDHLDISYGGTVTNAEPLAAQGAIDLDVASVRALAAWTGNPIEGLGEEASLGRLAIQGTLDLTGQRIAFTGATVTLDEMIGKGDLRLDLAGSKPSVVATLDVEKINLNPYLSPSAAEPGEAPASSPETAVSGDGSGAPAPTGWSDEPIDLSALNSANLEFDFHTGGIEVQQLEIGETRLAAVLKDGRLVLDIAETALYGGQGKGRITVDASGAVPSLAKSMELSGLQAAPFLTDAADFDRIEGTANMTVEVTTQGRSQKEMVSALDGNGRVQFLDGAIRGINIAAMVRNVSSAFLNAEAGEAQKTDFAELAGSFTIADGILSNEDLALKSPLLRVEGTGTVDLPARTVDYRVTPKVVASLEGQGGQEQLGGIMVPVVVKGPWHDLSYAPDLSGAVDQIAKDPAKALDAVKGLVGGEQPGTEDAGGEDAGDELPGAAPKAEDLIRGLLDQ